MACKFGIIVAALLAAAPTLAAEGPPAGWFITGSKPSDYRFGTEHVEGSIGRQSAYIQAKPGATDDGSGTIGFGFGTLMQTIKADDYLGQRLRLSMRLKSEGVVSLQMFFRVDSTQGKAMHFANMQQQPVTGTTGWKRYELVLDVPPGSMTINYGFFLVGGKGKGWADGTTLEPVEKNVPTSDQPGNLTLSRKPVNLGFDQ